MIDHKKYPQTLAEFDAWLEKKYEIPVFMWNDALRLQVKITGRKEPANILLDDEMIHGVLLAYFDSIKIHITLDHDSYQNGRYHWYYWIFSGWKFGGILNRVLCEYREKDCKTRSEALKAAFEKAAEIREKQLEEL